MMDIWSWICELPDSATWSESESESSLTFQLASKLVSTQPDSPAREIQLTAVRTTGSNSEPLVTFTVSLHGFHPVDRAQILWTSDACPLSSEKPFLPLVLQLLQEIIARSPTAHDTTCPRSQLQRLKPDPVSWIMDSHSPESFSTFFNLVFLTRLFWLCSFDAPAEAGSLYFESLLQPNLEMLERGSVLKAFLVAVGVDVELCFMRTLGYVLAKWRILREVGVVVVGLGLLASPPPRQHVGFSYAHEAHGLWTLKGYAPVLAMSVVSSSSNKNSFPILDAKDSVLQYALAHQQLEAVIQLDYSVEYTDACIQVRARVDNVRFHVTKLAFSKSDEVEFGEERHFVSRARIWVGPEVGATYVGGMSLGRSTDNGERELEMQRSFENSNTGVEESKVPGVKARTAIGTRTKLKNWHWDQDVEGNAAVCDFVMYDNMNGREIYSSRPIEGSSGTRNRYNGPNRPFTKMGGVVFGGDEYGKGFEWRLSKEMEGSVLKWRIGGHVWVTYWPNEVKSSYYETRCVEWCDEVDLPLIPAKQA